MSSDYLTLGIQAARAGDRQKARQLLEKALEQKPDSAEAWLWLGRCTDDPERRKYCYHRALALEPTNAEAWRSLDELSIPLLDQAKQTETSQSTADRKALGGPRPRKQPRPFWQVSLTGFLLTLLLFGLPAAILTLSGRLDWLLFESYREPMPPIYSHWVDRLVTPTQLAIPTGTFDARLATAQPLLDEAFQLMQSNRCAEALPLLDQAVALVPDDDLPYYRRSICYLKLTSDQRELEQTLSNVYASLADIDQAIQLSPEDGDYYAERGLVYYEWASLEELRVDSDALYAVAIQNLQAASALGTTTYYPIEPARIDSLVESGRCDEGLAQAQKFLSEAVPDALHYTDVMVMEARAYACLGKLPEALDSLQKAMDQGPLTDQQEMLEAVLLYQLGQPDQALKLLDSLIVQSPGYNGDRYYLRALIYYEKGNRDEAYRSLIAGSGNSWFHGGLYTYVQGRMGLGLPGADNREKALAALQYAEASLDVTYNVFRQRLQTELGELGVRPLSPTVSVPIQPTSVPTFAVRPTARPTSTATPSLEPSLSPTMNPAWTATLSPTYTRTVAAGTLVPTYSPTVSLTPTVAAPPAVYLPPGSSVTIVDVETGTGIFSIAPGERKLLRFQPALALTITNVKSLSVYLKAADTSKAPSLLLELWNPYEGSWTSLQPYWGENRVNYPAQFILPEGDVYIAVRNLGNRPVEFQNFSIVVVFNDQNGDLWAYGSE